LEGRVDWLCLSSYVATCQAQNKELPLNLIASFPCVPPNPFLFAPRYAPSTDPVREENLVIFIAATYVAKGRPRRYQVML